MGTVVTIDVYATAEVTGAELAAARAQLGRARAILHRADEVFSTWRPDSPVSRLRRGEISPAQAPAEVAGVLEQCAAARELSGGWFDPWAMPGGVDPTGYVKGWAAQQALAAFSGGTPGRGTPEQRPPASRAPASRLAALSSSPIAPLSAPPPPCHPGADDPLATGRRRSAAPQGVTGVIVNAAGDIAGLGGMPDGQPFRIGIADPAEPRRLAAAVRLTGAIATSGTYERGDHLVDPHTARPAARAASASVTGPDLGLADALATALAVAGEEGLGFADPLAGYEALVIGFDGSRQWTQGFPFASREVTGFR